VRFSVSVRSLCAVVSVGIVLTAAPARAQMTGAPTAGYRQAPGQPSSSMPAALREIGFDQNLDQLIPLDVTFKDESGRTVRLGDYFGTRPVVLLFAYYNCPMLCTQVMNGLASTLNVLTLEPGRDFEVVTVSFDPHDTPASATAKKAQTLTRYKHEGAAAGWHFLSGDQASITRLTKAAGFRYVWDQQTSQFAHPSGVIVLTPEGRLSRYLFGIEYGPRDLRLGLIEASAGKIGTPVDALLLYCYHYDPMTGRYGLVIMRTIRLCGAATLLGLGAFVFVMIRREKHPAQHPAPGTAPSTKHQARGTR